MTDSLLITNCSLLTEPDAALIPRGYLRISGGAIRELGDIRDMPPAHGMQVLDADRQLAMPGLVNSHNHCPMTLFRGLADDLDLVSWLQNHIFPAEATHVNPEMVTWCTKLAAAEMLLSGTTTVADGYFHADAVARALADSGMRAVVGHGIIDFPAPGVPDPARNVDAVARFIDVWSGKDPLLTPAVFAHSPYTCSPATLTGAKRLADDRGVRFFLHLAETSRETGMLIDPQGTSPVRHLHALGLLDSSTVCVHSIWLDDQDLDILATTGVKVVTCPQSNLKLASGTARISEMLARNITVGLGTDGCASNNTLDMFREMDMLAKAEKLRTLEATAVPAAAALRCATTAGAVVLGIAGVGKLAVGHPADIILLDLAAPHLTPFYNTDLLVYAARGSDVRTVIVDGTIVVRDKTILSFDMEAVLAEGERLATALRNTTR